MHHWTELRTQPWEGVWRLPTPCTPVGSQRALSYIIEMLSREAVHSRTVFNLRDVLMAFWDRLFPPWFSREAGGSVASSLKKEKKKREKEKKVFLLQECSESPLLQLASLLVRGEVKKWGEGREASVVSSNDWPRGLLALKQESCLSLPQIPNWSSEVKCKSEPT